MRKLAIVSLLYLEPDYKQTLQCLRLVDHADTFFADRDGVGNMSRAFNDAFKKHVQGRFEYVWFVTNVRFLPTVPAHLVHLLDNNSLSAVHPTCASSDHAFLHPGEERELSVNVPFVELMAPMFRTQQFAHAGMFPEDCWYWYMDLAISYELRRRGYMLGVANHASVEHTYLRNATPHPVTQVRQQMRGIMRDQGRAYMEGKYGKNWQAVVGWKE